MPSRGVRGFRWRLGQHELLLPFKSHQGGSPSCCELQKQFSNPFTATLRLKLTQMGLSWPSPGPSNKVRLPLNEIFAEQRLRHFPPRPSCVFFSPVILEVLTNAWLKAHNRFPVSFTHSFQNHSPSQAKEKN